MTQKFYVNLAGDYLGSFDGAPPPQGAIEVLIPPTHGAQKWSGAAWLARVLTQTEINDAAKAALLALDLASIRGLREYIAGKNDAPQSLKDKEAAAAIERGKII